MAETRFNLTALLAGTRALLTSSGTDATTADSARVAVFDHDARARLGTPAIDAFSITRAVPRVLAGLGAGAALTHSVTATLVIGDTVRDLLTDTGGQVTFERARTASASRTAFNADLIIRTNTPRIAMDI